MACHQSKFGVEDEKFWIGNSFGCDIGRRDRNMHAAADRVLVPYQGRDGYLKFELTVAK